MALNLAAKLAEKVMGDIPTSTTQAMYRHPTGEKMKAVVWHGKQDVRVDIVEKPQVVEPTDALIRVRRQHSTAVGLKLVEVSPPAFLL